MQGDLAHLFLLVVDLGSDPGVSRSRCLPDCEGPVETPFTESPYEGSLSPLALGVQYSFCRADCSAMTYNGSPEHDVYSTARHH